MVEQLGFVAAHPQDLPRPPGVTLDIDGLRNPHGPVDPRDHGPVEAETACLFRNSIDQLRDGGDPMEPPECILHAREGRDALGEPGLAKSPLGVLELQEKVDRLGAAPRKGCVLPILPESLGDMLRRGCQGSLRGRKVDDRQARGLPWSTQVAHAVEHRQDVTHGGAGNLRAMPEPRLLAIPGACGLGAGCPGHQAAGAAGDWRVAVRGPSAAGADPGGCAGRRDRHQVPGTGAVRGADAGCCAGIRDHHGQPSRRFMSPRASP